MKKLLSISVLVLGLAASACGPTGSDSGDDSCSSDNDCKGDRICDGGECVSPGGGGGSDNNGGNGGGGGSDNNGGGSDNNGGGGGEDYTAYCCVNGAFFGCSSLDDADACVFEDGGEEKCTRDMSYDASYCDDDGGGGGGDDNNDNNDNNGGGGGGGSDKKATGETCEVNSECEGSVCLVRGSGDILGYCSNRCENFSDCPTFWDCEELANAAGKYCVED